MNSTGKRHVQSTGAASEGFGDGPVVPRPSTRNGSMVSALTAFAVIALLGASAPSQAVVVEAPTLRAGASFADPAGDATDPYNAGTGDIVSAKVTHTSRVVTASYTLAADGGFPNGVYWQFDTKAGDPGPEFLVGWTYDAPGSASVVRIKDWASGWAGGGAGTPVRCKGARMKGLDRGQKLVVPRSCLATKGAKPRKVRAHVETSDLSSQDATDYAPDVRTFGGWVRTG